MKKTALTLMVWLIWAVPALAETRPDPGAPEELAAWRSWVLYGHEEQLLCPAADTSGRRFLCSWPVRLTLNLDDQGGNFTAVFELKNERAFVLPGGPGAWPVAVTDLNGAAVPVAGRDRPQVWLPAGRHSLKGSFHWSRLPETLTLPAGFAMDLKINGHPLDFPALEVDYQTGQVRLWLREKSGDPMESGPALSNVDRLTVNVNRLIQDSQPMMIKSRFRLTVSGRPREVILDNVLLPETRATFLSSPLPAQLTPEGLRVRVKPGTYEIFIDSRAMGRSENLGPVPGREFPDSAVEAENGSESSADLQELPAEYWAFQADTNLRLAEISGAPQIDASQADVYPAWRQYPVYLIKPGQGLKFATIRRGDAEPKPDDLRLNRECWLDYNGRGLSCRDRMTGTLSRQWHLNTSRPFTLAQASLDGQPQIITWQLDSKGQPAPGLQLRGERVNLSADLRIDDFTGVLPASGWDHKLETGGQKFNLPPGYRLFHVSGAETLQGHRNSGSGTWTGAWETLDFFIILIITIAVWKLYGRPQGILALATMIFCYHEPMAPRMIFLHLLAAAALMRLLPHRGKARFVVKTWRFLAALVLVVFAAVFLIQQARVTLHPQLENPGAWFGNKFIDFALPGTSFRAVPYQASMDYYDEDISTETEYSISDDKLPAAPPSPEPTGQLAMEEMSRNSSFKSFGPGRTGGKSMPASTRRMVNLSQSPDAIIQNSMPRPSWNWRSVTLYYNTSVTADQEIRLYLQSPTIGRILGLTRIGLMAGFTLIMLAGGRLLRRPHRMNMGPAAAAFLAVLGLFLISASPALAQNTFPDRELLKEYQLRLLKRSPQPELVISEAVLKAEAANLTLILTVEAVSEDILGLPNLDREIFRIESLTIGGQDLGIVEDQGRWLTLVPAGRNQLTLTGRLKKPAINSGFQVNFPNEFRPQRVLIQNSPAWKIEGLERDGQLLSNGLFLSPDEPETTEKEAAGRDEAEQGTSETLSPFFLVNRTLSLGLELEWRVLTSVERVTPIGAPVSLKLPLLPGETPITGNLRPDDGRVTLNFGPQVESLNWESSLPAGPELTLIATEGAWTESWLLDASPIWRVEARGLTPIHNVSGGYWQPYWRPWPGESLTLTVDRPEPVPGQYLVIDRATLNVTVGEHNQLNSLNFHLRTSQGGPYGFELPPGSEVREFKVNGRNVPLSSGLETSAQGRGPTLTTSLNAGEHKLEAIWLQDMDIGPVAVTPTLDLKAPTANLNLRLTLPQDRWILWTWGPLQGPAVEFWSLAVVILLVSLVLAKLALAPLSWAGWFLLGLGLIQVNVVGTLVVVGWLLLLGRRRRSPPTGIFRFNAGQVLLAVWTGVSLVLIYYGIKFGLLQNPDMFINGGGSYGQYLSWFTDRVSGLWPTGSALSVSVWSYKALMLAWSLWLAVSLVTWLKWGWESFSRDGLWRNPQKNNTARTDSAPDQPVAHPAPIDDHRVKNGDGN